MPQTQLEHDVPTEHRLESLTKTTFFQFVTPTLLMIVITFGGSYIHDLKVDMQTLKDAASEARAINADKESRIRMLEALVPRRETQIADLNASIQSLRQDVAVLKYETSRTSGH